MLVDLRRAAIVAFAGALASYVISASASMNPARLLERFLRYVRIDTTANPDTDEYPSSPGQWDLGKLLVAELKASGVADAHQDDKAIVWGTIPANNGKSGPAIAFNAHLDTSPETTGKNVNPQVIRQYPGGDISLPANKSQVIRVADNPELTKLVGKTLVTTDGNTLLGADDKSGIAVIMELVDSLREDPSILHGPVKVLFTCDEEIGRGVKHVDLKKLGSIVGYTLDGAATGELDVETFSADGARVTVRGVNIHPSIGKGRMINALRGAGEFLARLPRGKAPETTGDRQGFIHPYRIEGGVAEVVIHILLRDFDSAQLALQANLLRETADEIKSKLPGMQFDIQITQQYRNLGEGLIKEPRAVTYVEDAYRKLGRTVKKTIIRGGTDGSQFTSLGLPTPNLSTGEHNPHSPLEFTCLEEMADAVEVCREIVRRWGE